MRIMFIRRTYLCITRGMREGRDGLFMKKKLACREVGDVRNEKGFRVRREETE